MTESPEFILSIAALHWLLCARIYYVCIVSDIETQLETVPETKTKQPETEQPAQSEPVDLVVMVDGVVDWGEVDYKNKSK